MYLSSTSCPTCRRPVTPLRRPPTPPLRPRRLDWRATSDCITRRPAWARSRSSWPPHHPRPPTFSSRPYRHRARTYCWLAGRRRPPSVIRHCCRYAALLLSVFFAASRMMRVALYRERKCADIIGTVLFLWAGPMLKCEYVCLWSALTVACRERVGCPQRIFVASTPLALRLVQVFEADVTSVTKQRTTNQ